MKYTLSKSCRRPAATGFVLLTTIILLASCTMLVVAYFSISKNEVTSSRRYSDRLKAEMGAHAAFEEAKLLLQEFSNNDDYLVTMIPNKSTYGLPTDDGDPDDEHSNTYYFISQPQDNGTVNHIPLFAGGLAHSTTIHEGPTWQRDRVLETADGVLGTKQESTRSATVDTPVKESQTPFTSWLRPPAQSTKGDIRYTYWIQDLQGSVQYDKVGYSRVELDGYDPVGFEPKTFAQGASGTTINGDPKYGQGDSIVLGFPVGDPRHSGRVLGHGSKDSGNLNYWFPDALRNPFLGPTAAAQTNLAGQMAPGLSTKEMITSFQYEPWTQSHAPRFMKLSRAAGLLSTTDLAGWGTNNFVFGLRPYLERQRIPKGFGYDTTVTQPGYQPGDRGNLNAWVAQGDEAGALSLASYMSDVLPADWANRGGGIATSLGSNDYSLTYLRALAANIIDYADADSTPIRDATGLDRGYMRGVEAMPMVNEVAFQFRWQRKTLLPNITAPTKWQIELVVTPIIEFWNPTNQPVSSRNVGLVFWDTPGTVVLSGLGSRVATHYRIAGKGAYLDAYLSPGDPSGYLTDILSGGSSRMTARDLILWKTVSLPPNGFKAHIFDSIRFVFEFPTIPGAGQTSPVLDIAELKLRGEQKNGALAAGNDRASRYVMVFSDGPTDQTVENHILYDEAHGRTERHGGGNATLDWEMIDPEGSDVNLYASNNAVHDGYDHETRGSGRIINVGDPFASFYLTNLQDLIGFGDSSSLGGRNYRARSSTIKGNNELTEADGAWQSYILAGAEVRTQKEVRPNCWPDGGYLTVRGQAFTGDEEAPLPDDYDGGVLADGFTVPEPNGVDATLLAPFRLNNSGRFWSVTELGHVWDPIFWWEPRGTDSWLDAMEFEDNEVRPSGAQNARVGGGNTLRIGRAEHPRLRHDVAELGATPTDDDWKAIALLDVFQAGHNGSNVGVIDRPAEYDPEWHIDPPTARNAAEAASPAYDYHHIYGPELHAESPYRYINGHINANTTVFSWSDFAISYAPYSSDPGYGVNHQKLHPEGVSWENWGLNRWGHPNFGTHIQRNRPYYSPSQFADLWNKSWWKNNVTAKASIPSNKWPTEDLKPGNDPDDSPPSEGEFGRRQEASSKYPRPTANWVDMSDAVREEQFARMFNLTNLSSRNFRIFVMGEYLAANGKPVASSRKVYEVFAKPIRDANGLVSQVKIEVISEKDQ